MQVCTPDMRILFYRDIRRLSARRSLSVSNVYQLAGNVTFGTKSRWMGHLACHPIGRLVLRLIFLGHLHSNGLLRIDPTDFTDLTSHCLLWLGFAKIVQSDFPINQKGALEMPTLFYLSSRWMLCFNSFIVNYLSICFLNHEGFPNYQPILTDEAALILKLPKSSSRAATP